MSQERTDGTGGTDPAVTTDVLVVGAGLSGIGAAVRLRQRCPELSVSIVEARSDLGGTWDLFRYPGVRSDSDAFTLSYPFRPWRGENSIADGPEILAYLRETAEQYGITELIEFDRRVVTADWSGDEQGWTVGLRGPDGTTETRTTRFLLLCSGYYAYDRAYAPVFPGQDDFAGTVVHPQFWPEQLDLAGRKVVIIGSGATAITLAPVLAARAAESGGSVTVVQRSPSYVAAVPRRDRVADRLRARLPARLAHHAVRTRNIAFSSLVWALSRHRPETARRMLLDPLSRRLPPSMITDHFSPSYGVWDQRLCATPDGEFFRVVGDGRLGLRTDVITRWEAGGVRLGSGELVEADVIVTATGLVIELFGNIALRVDGRPVPVSETVVHRGCMAAGVPNLAATIGYVNASWTLRSDLAARYVCRLLRFMIRNDYRVVAPVLPTELGRRPLLPLSSGYVQRGRDALPSAGDRGPWRVRQSYPVESVTVGRAPLRRDLEFSR